MRRLVSTLALGLFIGSVSAAVDDKPCDLSNLKAAPYCGKCHTIDPKVDMDGKCCGSELKEVWACVKTCFECSGCHKLMVKDESCCKGMKNEGKTVKALIVYKCEGCGATAEKEGNCANAKCKAAGKKIKKTCEKSGTCPHIAS